MTFGGAGIEGVFLPDAPISDPASLGPTAERAIVFFMPPTLEELFWCAVVATAIWGVILFCLSGSEDDMIGR